MALFPSLKSLLKKGSAEPQRFYRIVGAKPSFSGPASSSAIRCASAPLSKVTSIEHWQGSYDFAKATKKTTADSYPTSKLMLMLMAFALAQRGTFSSSLHILGVYTGVLQEGLRGAEKIREV